MLRLSLFLVAAACQSDVQRVQQVAHAKSRPSNSLSSVAMCLNERTRSPRRCLFLYLYVRDSVSVCVCDCMTVCCPLQPKLYLHALLFLVSTAVWGLVCSPNAAASCSMCCGLCLD